MKVNPELIRVIQESNLPEEEALLFCAAVELQEYGVLNYILMAPGLITIDNEHLYRINLCEVDVDKPGIKYKLRVPLFKDDGPSVSFNDFLKLLTEKNVRHNGHSSNPLSYSILSAEDDEALKTCMRRLKTTNIQRLADVTAEYYFNTTYAKKLKDFLLHIAPLMFNEPDVKDTLI